MGQTAKREAAGEPWTAGPWQRVEMSRGLNPAVARVREQIVGNGRGALVIEYGPPHAEGEANARLIAAAPEMATFLQRYAERGPHDLACDWAKTRSVATDCNCWRRDARALLARVRGEV